MHLQQTEQSIKLDLKYHHKPANEKSFAPFIQKLKDKNQTEQQRKQAFDAVSIFYQVEKEKNDQYRAKVLDQKNENISTKKIDLKSSNTNWNPVYNGLNSEIKLRHYSPKTTMVYTHTIQSRTIKEAKSPLDF